MEFHILSEPASSPRSVINACSATEDGIAPPIVYSNRNTTALPGELTILTARASGIDPRSVPTPTAIPMPSCHPREIGGPYKGITPIIVSSILVVAVS
jgi:hypothetical protein